MKRGDILINRLAGHIDCRYFIYLGTQGDWIVGLEFIEGRPRKTRYYRSDMDRTLPDSNIKAYEVVGHTDFLQIARKDLDNLKKEDDKYGTAKKR